MGAEHATAVSPALTPDAQDDFKAASLVLRRYGLNLAAAFDQEAGHDVLMTRTMPREDLEYKHVLADMSPEGTLGPRVKTSYHRGVARVVIFEASPPRPVLEILARSGEGVTLTVLDPSVRICLSVDGTAYDLTTVGPEARGTTTRG
jgi:hypothetical protein